MLTITKMRRYFVAIAMIAMVFITPGCEKEDEGPTQNIWEIISTNSELTSLSAELEAQGLNTLLESDGTFTLFAPSNQALTDLLSTLGLPDFSPVRADIAQAVLAYHVLASKVASSEVVAGAQFNSYYNNEEIDVIAGPLLKTGATSQASVIEADIQATNGVIHIIDKVLIPYPIGESIVALLGTVGQSIYLGANFSTLADAANKADGYAAENELPTLRSFLADRTSGDKYTVFAPVNGVFTQAGITLETYTAAQWYGIIANHVVKGETNWTDFVVDDSRTSLAGATLTILTIDTETNPAAGITSGVTIDSNSDGTSNAQIAVENAAPGSNGVIHAIAGVLAPPQ